MPSWSRPRGVPAAAAALLHRRADEPLHLDVDRGDAGRRPAALPPGAARQRPDRRACRPGRPPGAALHPLLGLPERVPGVRADRRPRVRLGLSRADRRGAVPAADRDRGRTPRCRTRPRCAAPATTPARSRSTSRRFSSTCAPGTSRRHAASTGCRGPRPIAMAAASWVMSDPRRFAAAQRSSRAGRAARRDPAGSPRCRRRWPPGPGPATRRARQPRRSANGGATSAGRSPMSAREEMLGRIRAALGPGEPAAGDAAPPGYRTAGQLARGPLLDLLAERLADYRAHVQRVAPDRLPDAITAALAERGARRVVVPPGLTLPPTAGRRRGGHRRRAVTGRAGRGRRGHHRVPRSRSPRPGRSCWTAAPAQGAGPSPWCPTITCASCAPSRWSSWCPRRWRDWPAGPAAR